MSQGIENRAPLNMRHFGAYMDEVLNFNIKGVSRPTNLTPDNRSYQPSLAIFSRDERNLRAIQAMIINGTSWNLNDQFLKTPANGHREWYLITGNSVECYIFVQWVKPFLTFKQAQAQVFDEFLRQKREVRRYIQGLVIVPSIYDNPYERMEVEEDLQRRLLQTKHEIIPESTLPQPERLAGTIDADMSLGLYCLSRAEYRLEFLARGDMVSTRFGLLKVLWEEYGGTKPVKSSDVSKTKLPVPTYKWQINGDDLERLLIDTEPHLVFKRARARFIMKFLQVRRDPLMRVQRNRILQSFLNEWSNIDPLPKQDQGQ